MTCRRSLKFLFGSSFLWCIMSFIDRLKRNWLLLLSARSANFFFLKERLFVVFVLKFDENWLNAYLSIFWLVLDYVDPSVETIHFVVHLDECGDCWRLRRWLLRSLSSLYALSALLSSLASAWSGSSWFSRLLDIDAETQVSWWIGFERPSARDESDVGKHDLTWQEIFKCWDLVCWTILTRCRFWI